MKKNNNIKEYFRNKSDKEIFSILLFFSCITIMLLLAIFRFCGIGYFANNYKEHTFIPWVQDLILFALKWIELIFILATLAKIKFRYAIIIAFIYANIYWFINNAIISFVIDVIYYMFIPFLINKFDYKRITYGIFLMAIITAYQFLMMSARYSINLSEKFNYIAMIESVFDYKIFIISIYFLIYNWRLKLERINTPNPEDEKNYGGGGCTLFWGKFEKFCQIVGMIIISICSIGIVPLAVFLYRKNKQNKSIKNEAAN